MLVKDIKKFTFKIFKLILLPLLILLILYLVLDPFKVVHKYNSFYIDREPSFIQLDRDYVSTTTYDKQYKKYDYNSFIFGNSRSIFYPIKDWKLYLAPTSHCFHFDASGESLYGIYKKVLYVDKKSHISNAIILLDKSTLENISPRKSHIVYVAPQLDGDYIGFHFTFFKEFVNPEFIFSTIILSITNKKYNWMGNNIDDRPINYKLKYNELSFNIFEQQIRDNKYYTKKRMSVFYKRPTNKVVSDICIKEKQKAMLQDIMNVFYKNKTNVKIIINPLYDQIYLNQKDISALKEIFGVDNVYDYSGVNKFTKDYHNYYENSHYRPCVAREIMKEIYTK